MNANELADALDDIGDKYLVILGDIHFKEAAAFVRQQQAEIEALKKELETCKTIVALANIAWERKAQEK